ncbi:Phytanoyl-CoA dioxygenase [Legionella birminghamensis]|uniref:Phytanoyl-CoA dioxygenase n=1 Tax=Legionella birminghamensis TaxID=28083 RepID=A0A378I7E8_9GAMM|nr:phytanoyl-CoA dioxygenase family protein [Legionella birminghamensis]KTC68153.1 Phytanoyl-CoA dioxygenase [Legionella birminghamensis]STX31137.1 Phytanoyl-CoA dioxygenase [Legionella birminghamensis]
MLWNQDEASIITQYQLDGAVCIRQVLGPQEISTLTRGIEKNLRDLSPRSKVASRPDDPGYFVEDFCTWQTNPFYQDLIFNSQLGEVAAKLTNSRCIRLYHDHLLVKEAGTLQATPWHQDQPYYNIDGFQNCSIWIPVDPISPKAALRFISGSHLGPWLMPRSFMDQQAKWFPEGSLAELPDIERNPQDYEIKSWAMQPGDILCFHMLSLHSSQGAESTQGRRAFSLRFLGDDIIHAPRAWTTSPDFPGLANELAAGASMRHPLFPVVWGAD